MDPAQVIFVIAFIAFIIYLGTRGGNVNPTIKPDSFSQAGVVVDYTARTIMINGKTYPVESVRGLRSVQEWNRSFAYITMTDLVTPVHQIRFNGTWNKDAAETFIARLQAALDQAGGPRFQ